MKQALRSRSTFRLRSTLGFATLALAVLAATTAFSGTAPTAAQGLSQITDDSHRQFGAGFGHNGATLEQPIELGASPGNLKDHSVLEGSVRVVRDKHFRGCVQLNGAEEVNGEPVEYLIVNSKFEGYGEVVPLPNGQQDVQGQCFSLIITDQAKVDIKDSTFSSMPGHCSAGVQINASNNVTIKNSRFERMSDGVFVGSQAGKPDPQNIAIKSNFFAPPQRCAYFGDADSATTHNDQVQIAAGSNVDVVGNMIYLPTAQTASLLAKADQGNLAGIKIENNIVGKPAGSGFSLYCQNGNLGVHVVESCAVDGNTILLPPTEKPLVLAASDANASCNFFSDGTELTSVTRRNSTLNVSHLGNNSGVSTCGDTDSFDFTLGGAVQQPLSSYVVGDEIKFELRVNSVGGTPAWFLNRATITLPPQLRFESGGFVVEADDGRDWDCVRVHSRQAACSALFSDPLNPSAVVLNLKVVEGYEDCSAVLTAVLVNNMDTITANNNFSDGIGSGGTDCAPSANSQSNFSGTTPDSDPALFPVTTSSTSDEAKDIVLQVNQWLDAIGCKAGNGNPPNPTSNYFGSISRQAHNNFKKAIDPNLWEADHNNVQITQTDYIQLNAAFQNQSSECTPVAGFVPEPPEPESPEPDTENTDDSNQPVEWPLSTSSTGDEVTNVQTWLRVLNCKAANGNLPTVTGSFFSITGQAVASYQERVGAEQTQSVDIGTYYSLQYNATQSPPTNTCLN